MKELTPEQRDWIIARYRSYHLSDSEQPLFIDFLTANTEPEDEDELTPEQIVDEVLFILSKRVSTDIGRWKGEIMLALATHTEPEDEPKTLSELFEYEDATLTEDAQLNVGKEEWLDIMCATPISNKTCDHTELTEGCPACYEWATGTPFMEEKMIDYKCTENDNVISLNKQENQYEIYTDGLGDRIVIGVSDMNSAREFFSAQITGVPCVEGEAHTEPEDEPKKEPMCLVCQMGITDDPCYCDELQQEDNDG